MKKIIFSMMIVLTILVKSFSEKSTVYAAVVDPQLGQVYDWTSVLNDYSQHKNKIYQGPYYKIGIIGKHDRVHVDDDISLEFRLVDDYIGDYKTKAQIQSMGQTQYTSVTLQNQVGLTVSTTVGQSSVAKLGLSLGNTGNASVSQSNNFSTTLTTEQIYTETQLVSNQMSFNFNLNVIPSNQPYFGYGKVAVYVKYKITKSYRWEDIWFIGWREEAGSVRTNYYGYKYLFAIDTFIYPNDTFGDTVTGIYSYGTFALN